MPLKKSQPRTTQQLKEVLELINWRIASYPSCMCMFCRMDRAMYMAQRDAISWALGRNPKQFCGLIDWLRRARSKTTEHQHSHSE